MIPSLALISIDCSQARLCGRRLRIWAPLFLLWIPAILLAPLIFVVLAVACAVGHVSLWRAIGTLWALFCGLRGTDVVVRAEGNLVKVRIV